MERVKDAKTLRCGGSREGFQGPDQLRNETEKSRRRIVDEVMLHAKDAFFKGHLFEKLGQ